MTFKEFTSLRPGDKIKITSPEVCGCRAISRGAVLTVYEIEADFFSVAECTCNSAGMKGGRWALTIDGTEIVEKRVFCRKCDNPVEIGKKCSCKRR